MFNITPMHQKNIIIRNYGNEKTGKLTFTCSKAFYASGEAIFVGMSLFGINTPVLLLNV